MVAPNNALTALRGRSGPDAMSEQPEERLVTLDVRGMEPPEPMLRVLETIDRFGEHDRLRLVIDCTPTPLLRILDRNGFDYEMVPGRESVHEITIRRRPGAAR